MKYFPLIFLFIFSFIAASPQVKAQKPTKDVFGKTIGASNWGLLKRSQSQLSFTRDGSIIVKREGRNFPNRYQEKLQLKNGGFIFYEELFSGFFSDTFASKPFLINFANKATKKVNIQISEHDIKRADFADGELHYATKSSANNICVSFNATVGETGAYGTYGNKHLNGIACRQRNHFEATGLEKRILSLLNSIRFDEGKLNKVKGVLEEAKANRQADQVKGHFENTKTSEKSAAPKVDLMACFKNPKLCKNKM